MTALQPGGWFIFSVEEMLPDHDGVCQATGTGRCSDKGVMPTHKITCTKSACAAGFRVARMDRPVIRQEAGAAVPGLLLTLERVGHDD